MSELLVQLVTSHPIYTDKKSGAKLNVAIFEPDFPDDSWFFLGHLARPMPGSWDYTDDEVISRAPTALVVKPKNDPNVLCKVTPYQDGGRMQPLWTDEHSGGQQDIELYSFSGTSAEYIPMGLFASIVEEYGQDPTANPSWSRLAAIRNELVHPGASGPQIWNDHDSGADGSGLWRNVSIWSVVGAGLYPPGGFVAAQDYPTSPSSTTPAAYLLSPAITDQ